MVEKEQVVQAREQLKSSMKAVYRDLKLYGKAVNSRNKAVLKNVGNSIINTFEKLNVQIELNKIEKAQRKAEKRLEKIEKKEREKNERQRKFEELKRKIEAEKEEKRIQKEQKKAARAEGRLNFKNGVKQKVSSAKSRLGRVGNSVLSKLHLDNIDVKIRNAFERAQIYGLSTLNAGVSILNSAKNKVSSFTSEQVQKYTDWRVSKQIKREDRAAEREAERQIREREIREELELRARTKEHKKGMIEALKEQKKAARAEGRLNFKNGVKQKASSAKSKLGRVGKSLLTKLNMANVDLKLKNAFERAQIGGLTALNAGVSTLNSAKNKVSNFTSEQVQKYTDWRVNKQIEREDRAAEREAERQIREREIREELELRARTKEHKKGMVEALNEQERDEYNIEYEELNSRKQELIQSLIQERNNLLGIQNNAGRSRR